jgi:hypothetical protein
VKWKPWNRGWEVEAVEKEWETWRVGCAKQLEGGKTLSINKTVLSQELVHPQLKSLIHFA